MAEFPAMPLWTDRYFGDTRHLNDPAEHGAYLLLLMEAWRRPRCALPDDDTLLARLACCSPERWAELKPIVMAFWKLDKRRREWTQKGLMKERDYVQEQRQKQRDRISKRWNKTKKEDTTVVPRKNRGNTPTPTPTPTKTQDPESGKSPGGDLLSMNGAEPKGPPPFDEWWKVYPRKANKDGAEKAFKAALKKASLETLTTAAKNYAEFCKAQGTEEQYIAHASTWLNQKRWNDWLQPQTSEHDYGPEFRVVAGTLIRDGSQH